MNQKKKKILIEASGCHVHLTKEAIERLFGRGTLLKKRRDLSQPGEFLCEQRVKLVTKDGCIDNVAVLGPARTATQVELSQTDCRKLGLKAPINLSGNLEGASDVMIIGSHGEIKANGSVIVARNHIHMRPKDAVEYGVSDGDKVRVEIASDRRVIFEDVPIRVNEKFAPAMHIDFDEANACGYRVGTEAFILYDTPYESRGMSEMDMEQIIKEVTKQVLAMIEQQERGIDLSVNTGVASMPECHCSEVVCQKLITEKMAKEMVKSYCCDTVYIAKKTIITPAAKDIFRAGHKKIEIV